MRRLLLALGILLACSMSAHAQAIVNTTDGYGGDSTFVFTQGATAISHTAGNVLAVTVWWIQDDANPSAVSSVTNTALDTFTSSTKCTWGSAPTKFAQIWYVASTAGNASDVVTAHFNGAFGAKGAGVKVVQMSGMSATPLDNVQCGNGTSTSAATATITVSGSNEILLASGQNDFDSFSAGTGFSGAAWSSDANHFYESKTSVSANQTATYTCANAQWYIIGASWKPSGGAATPGCKNGLLMNGVGCLAQ